MISRRDEAFCSHSGRQAVAAPLIVQHLAAVSSRLRLKETLATSVQQQLCFFMNPTNCPSSSFTAACFLSTTCLPDSLPSSLPSFLWIPGPRVSVFVLPQTDISGSNLCVLCLDSPWKVYLSEVDPALTQVSVGGLTPARTYQFRLCAVNQVGRGQYSAETQR